VDGNELLHKSNQHMYTTQKVFSSTIKIDTYEN